VSWQEVARFGDIPDDEGFRVEVAGNAIALFKYEGEVYAIDDTCTHAEASLATGFLEDCQIECPLHQACFDIRTGKVTQGPATEDVRTYPARVENGAVLLDI
jgi:naphthalene 1,2-dioxygenase system ferredoxin subunit